MKKLTFETPEFTSLLPIFNTHTHTHSCTPPHLSCYILPKIAVLEYNWKGSGERLAWAQSLVTVTQQLSWWFIVVLCFSWMLSVPSIQKVGGVEECYRKISFPFSRAVPEESLWNFPWHYSVFQGSAAVSCLHTYEWEKLWISSWT